MKTNCKSFAITTALALLGLLSSSAAADAPPRLRIVTSFFPVYCLAAQVAGNAATVENLLPAGVGPHDYQFSPVELRKINSADIIVINGLGLENWMARAIQSSGGGRPKVVVELAAGIPRELLSGSHIPLGGEGSPISTSLAPLGGEGRGEGERRWETTNAHLWLNPLLMAHGASNIMVALQKSDPAHAEVYARNTASCVARLAQLDAEIRDGLASLKDRPFITYHQAFPYFVRHYNLTLAGVIEETPDVEPSPRHLATLLQTAREKKVRVVFTEPQFSSKLATQIGRDLNIPVTGLDPMETGPLVPGAYEAAMRSNLKILQKYLK